MSATDWADRMYGMLEPYTYADAQNNYSLQEFIKSIGEMYEEIIDLAYDTPAGDDGWTLLTDITRVPSKALDWLGQFVGIVPVAGLTDQQKVDRIIAREGFKRGTPEGMRAAAAIFLTGTQSVVLYERDTSPYHLTVQTYQSETAPGDLPTTNLLPHGGFESTPVPVWTGWGAVGVTFARSAEQAMFGSWSGKITTTTGGTDGAHYNLASGGYAPGDVLTWSIYVRPTVQVTMRLQAHCYNGGIGTDTLAGSPTVCPAGVWTRLTMTFTVAPLTNNIYFIVALGGAAVATTIYIDGGQIEKQAVATPYVETNGATASRGMGQGPVGAALRSQKPAGIVMVYNIIPGQTYQQLKTGHPLYSQVKSFYTNYDKVRSDTP